MMNRNADGLAWLRETRRQIARECGSPKSMGDYFRSFRKQYEKRMVKNTADAEESYGRKSA